MADLIDIQSQIEKLQKQASDIKAKEFHNTIQDILTKMQAFGIKKFCCRLLTKAMAASVFR